MAKTFSELVDETRTDLERLRANPYCPERINDEVSFEPNSLSSGKIPQRQEIDHNEVMAIFKRKIEKIEG